MKSLILILAIFAFSNLISQNFKSIHEFEKNNVFDFKDELALKSSILTFIQNTKLTKKVFGYHTYWATKTEITNYDFSAISHLGYFSFEVDTATGSYSTVNGWLSSTVIDSALKYGVKPILVVTNFGEAKNKAFLNYPAKRKRFIDTALYLLKKRGGVGINIDFESVGKTQKDSLSVFLKDLSKALKAANPDYELSIAGPAVDWSGAFDLKSCAAACDYIIIMGYDYYWSGSENAGPVAPLQGPYYCVSRSVDTYLGAGVPQNKILLGVPWYGYSWRTVDSTRMSTTLATANSITFALAEEQAAKYGKIYDDKTKSVYYKYKLGDTAWYQTWYDDSLTLGLKYEYVNANKLAGIGVWAISYSKANKALWTGIKAAFTAPEFVEEDKTLLNYINISGKVVSLNSSTFSIYDNIQIYDYLGNKLLDEQLNSTFTSQLKPGCYYIVLSNSLSKLNLKIVII